MGGRGVRRELANRRLLTKQRLRLLRQNTWSTTKQMMEVLRTVSSTGTMRAPDILELSSCSGLTFIVGAANGVLGLETILVACLVLVMPREIFEWVESAGRVFVVHGA
jgi:hypothetical protein